MTTDNERVVVIPELKRAYTAAPDGTGYTVCVLSLSDPTTEIARVRRQRSAFDPEHVADIQVEGDGIRVVSSHRLLERFSLDLESRGERLAGWRGEAMAFSTRAALVVRDYDADLFDLETMGKGIAVALPTLVGDVEGDAYALDPSGRHAAAARGLRYSHVSLVWCGAVATPLTEVPTLVVVDGWPARIAVAPGGRFWVMTLVGEQAAIAPAEWTLATPPDQEPVTVLEVMEDAKYRRASLAAWPGAWIAPGATLWADFLDEERVVLAGRAAATLWDAKSGTRISEIALPEAARVVAIDRAAGVLWVRTRTGFRACKAA